MTVKLTFPPFSCTSRIMFSVTKSLCSSGSLTVRRALMMSDSVRLINLAFEGGAQFAGYGNGILDLPIADRFRVRGKRGGNNEEDPRGEGDAGTALNQDGFALVLRPIQLLDRVA